MSKEIRNQEYQVKKQNRSTKTSKYFQKQMDYENYVQPLKNMNSKELQYFMENKFEKLVEKKPSVYNKLVKQVMDNLEGYQKGLEDGIYGGMKKFVGQHANRELTKSEIEKIKGLRLGNRLIIQNIEPETCVNTFYLNKTIYVKIRIFKGENKCHEKIFYTQNGDQNIFQERTTKNIKRDTLKILENYNEVIKKIQQVPTN